MLARLPKILMALALAGLIGLHWAFLQSIAWAGMVVTYSKSGPVTVALAKTFDGQHPCKLCRQIANGKQSERKSDYKFELRKLEFPYARFTFIFRAPSSFVEVRAGNQRADLLTHSPPVPPPRGFLA